MKKQKIIFDLEEFKEFLKELEEIEHDSGRHQSYDYAREDYYIDEKDGYIKIKRIWYMLDGTVKKDNEWEKFIKGEIINNVDIL